jgi:hypothetical protein
MSWRLYSNYYFLCSGLNLSSVSLKVLKNDYTSEDGSSSNHKKFSLPDPTEHGLLLSYLKKKKDPILQNVVIFMTFQQQQQKAG